MLCHLKSLIDVCLKFGLVPHEVDCVLVVEIRTVPQGEDDDDILGLSVVEEGLHVVDHRTRTIRTRDESVTVVCRCVVTLDMQPDTFTFYLNG